MKRFFKTTASLLTATTTLLGGISLSTICNQQSKAVYDRNLDYDPDLQPNYDSVDNLKSLENELHRLDWYGVCCISIGRFRAKGGFGIVPPGYKLSNRHTTAKWTIYKGWERTDYDVVKEYDNESDACKAFLRAVQRRAKERGKLTEWWWQPNVD